MTASKVLVPALSLSVLCGAFAGSPPVGGAGPSAPGATAESRFERVWGLATLYENHKNFLIQKLAFTGRLQADAAFFDSDVGKYERLEWRRVRLGFKASLFEDFTLSAEADLDANEIDVSDLDDSYNRLTDLFVGWSLGDSLTVKVGKQSAPFTLDGATSSKTLIALERSTVATNLWFPTEYFTGIAALGGAGDWTYHLGGYSASGDSEFGSFESGYFGLVSLGYAFDEYSGLDTSSVRLDYVYNDPDDTGNVGTRDLRHVVSLSSKFGNGAFGIWSDVSFGDGIGEQSDIFGLELMPYYDISERWQGVFRYTYVTGSGGGGVRLNRYESRITSEQFDDAHEFYLGLNWYVFGHKLKWQNGVEYTMASGERDGGYSGWGLSSGVRLSW